MLETARAPWRVRAVCAAGVLAFRDWEPGATDATGGLHEAALGVAQEAGDWDAERRALVGLARTALRDGDFAHVRELGERGQAIAIEHGDRATEWLPQHLQATSARMLDDQAACVAALSGEASSWRTRRGRPDRAGCREAQHRIPRVVSTPVEN